MEASLNKDLCPTIEAELEITPELKPELCQNLGQIACAGCPFLKLCKPEETDNFIPFDEESQDLKGPSILEIIEESESMDNPEVTGDLPREEILFSFRDWSKNITTKEKIEVKKPDAVLTSLKTHKDPPSHLEEKPRSIFYSKPTKPRKLSKPSKPPKEKVQKLVSKDKTIKNKVRKKAVITMPYKINRPIPPVTVINKDEPKVNHADKFIKEKLVEFIPQQAQDFLTENKVICEEQELKKPSVRVEKQKITRTIPSASLVDPAIIPKVGKGENSKNHNSKEAQNSRPSYMELLLDDNVETITTKGYIKSSPVKLKVPQKEKNITIIAKIEEPDSFIPLKEDPPEKIYSSKAKEPPILTRKVKDSFEPAQEKTQAPLPEKENQKVPFLVEASQEKEQYIKEALDDAPAPDLIFSENLELPEEIKNVYSSQSIDVSPPVTQEKQSELKQYKQLDIRPLALSETPHPQNNSFIECILGAISIALYNNIYGRRRKNAIST